MNSKSIVFMISSLLIVPAAMSAPSMTWALNTKEVADNITFGIQILDAAPVNEFYFSNQFGYTGGGNIGYIGIQPTTNASDGSRQFLVLFSSFRSESAASESNNTNCKSGADGGKGLTCKMYVPGALGDTFRFTVAKNKNTMTGTVTNETSGRKDTIGEWVVSDDAGNLRNYQVSWIENYKRNNPSFVITCDNKGWPYYEVKFLPPTANDGKIKGTLTTLSKASDDCPGAMTWTHDETGTLVKGGFK